MVSLLVSVDAGRSLRRIQERVRGAQLQDAKQLLTNAGRQSFQHVTQGKIHQPLDHFHPRDRRSFPQTSVPPISFLQPSLSVQAAAALAVTSSVSSLSHFQRFFVNEAFCRGPDGPVFLYIGGEGPIFEFDVLAGHHVDMAREHGALLLALEHRFYGDSINPDGLKTENLENLSSKQALVLLPLLADLVAFHQHISQSFNLSQRNTWISFGGSYSGSLSAWFRGQFPHLVFGAVASSAPVKATLDFSAYSDTVGLSLANEAVGGSAKCLDAVKEAFAAVEAALMMGNVSQVASDFGCCQTPKNLDDQIELMQELAGIFMGAVQYNEEGVFMSISDLCEVMTSTNGTCQKAADAYNRLVKLAQVYRSITEEPCLDVSHEKTLKDLMDTSPSPHAGRRSVRQWTYQTCTEFGFFQTCEDTTCPFSGMVTLQFETEVCPTVFGVSRPSLARQIAFTNTYYGGDSPRTHRVLYINGGIDPWKELSVTQDRSGDQVVFIEDTAHCADMRSQRVTDRSSLQTARAEIERHVTEWLKMASQERRKEQK
ncbi:Thymus-specific serine protease [Takifugu flavidus]|uniref:Thymus-specific serine protease n=1 Tax=Takifugu flavidus TaxID=433684 RepID=A0A5C6PAF8_9TELE|nr:Thymus-specific serine protease [Takifugu flavidus]